MAITFNYFLFSILFVCLFSTDYSFANEDNKKQLQHFQNQLDNRSPISTAPNRLRTKMLDRALKDAYLEDYNFIVRIKVVYNATTSAFCSGVYLEEQLVICDVTCIKYHGMANIEAKYLRILVGESGNETSFDVEQIYVNKLDMSDPGTELALLKLTRSITLDSKCNKLHPPDRNLTAETDTSVKIVGFTSGQAYGMHEFKEVRTKVGKRERNSKYICTIPGEINETPGSHLLKGAALLSTISCNNYKLLGILTRIETFTESIGKTKHQDCFVVVSAQAFWIDRVKQLATLAGKNILAENAPTLIEVPTE